MKAKFALVIAALILLAPAAAWAKDDSVFAKAGVRAAEVQREIGECQTLSAQVYTQELTKPGTPMTPGMGVMQEIIRAGLNKDTRARSVEVCMRHRGYAHVTLAADEASALSAQKTDEARAAWLDTFLARDDIGARAKAALTPQATPLPVARDLGDPYVIGAARIDPVSLTLAPGPVGRKGDVLTGKVRRRAVALLQEDFNGRSGIYGISAPAGTEFQEYYAPPPWDPKLSEDATAWCAKFKSGVNAGQLCFRSRLTGYSMSFAWMDPLWLVAYVGPEPFGAEAAYHFSMPLKVLPEDPREPLNLRLSIDALKPDFVYLSARATKDDKPCASLNCEAGVLWGGRADFDVSGRASFPFWDRTLVLTRAGEGIVTASFEPRADGKGWLDLPPVRPTN